MRHLLHYAMLVAWTLGIVYATIPAFWLFVHPFAGYWRRRKGQVYPLLGLVWLAMWGAAGWVTAPYRYQRIWPAWSWLLWPFILGSGITIYHKIGKGFGRAKLLGQAEVRPQEHEQRLITTGMHAKVRHPFYLAHWLMLTAWTVGAGTVALVALWCFAMVTGVLMIWFEDRELEHRFGAEYREYRRVVPAIIPKL